MKYILKVLLVTTIFISCNIIHFIWEFKIKKGYTWKIIWNDLTDVANNFNKEHSYDDY
jgi:hypothetical protein